MQHRSRFARQLCIAVDVTSYGSLDSVAQYDCQALLSDVLDEAAVAAGLDRALWRKQPQGDGELALVPPDQPEPRIVDDFVRELDATLRLRNFGRIPQARLRMRAAMDFGVAYEAPFGFAGEAVVATARLLASSSLHRAISEAADADLVVALSGRVYQTVLDRHTSLVPDEFVRAKVEEKEYSGEAWIRVLRRSASAASPTDEPAMPPPATSRRRSRRPSRLAAAPRYSVENTFNGSVDAEVIGINLEATSGEKS